MRQVGKHVRHQPLRDLPLGAPQLGYVGTAVPCMTLVRSGTSPSARRDWQVMQTRRGWQVMQTPREAV